MVHPAWARVDWGRDIGSIIGERTAERHDQLAVLESFIIRQRRRPSDFPWFSWSRILGSVRLPTTDGSRRDVVVEDERRVVEIKGVGHEEHGVSRVGDREVQP